MSNLNEEYFKKMAKKIYINPSKEALVILQEEYGEINERLEYLKKIDISNIQPLARISPPTTLLREDVEDVLIVLNKEVALANAAERKDDFVVIKRISK